MQSQTWLKPGITGAIVGGIATMVIGFGWGGWYLGGTAEKLAQTQANVAVIAALVPVCVGNQKADPEAATLIKTFAAIKTAYEQRDFVMKAGWATMPATDAPNRDLATACADALSKATVI